MLQVNEARKYLFTKKVRGLEGLPPTHNALKQHVMRATYQGGYVWGRQHFQPLSFLTPQGWTVGKKGHMQPRWTTITAAAVSCKELAHCGCKKSCSKRCKCVKAGLPCTPLCVCDGQCIREKACCSTEIRKCKNTSRSKPHIKLYVLLYIIIYPTAIPSIGRRALLGFSTNVVYSFLLL